MNKKSKQKCRLFFLNLFFIGLCFLGLVPILYAVILSISEGSGALTSGTGILPMQITFDNYRRILLGEPFLRWLLNSAVLSVGTMILAMILAIECGV